MKRGIYAIYDNKAADIVSILQVHSHEAVAIRTFTDVALQEQSQIQRHPEDFDLIRLGFLNTGNDLGITPGYQMVITGKTLIATLHSLNHKEEHASA